MASPLNGDCTEAMNVFTKQTTSLDLEQFRKHLKLRTDSRPASYHGVRNPLAQRNENQVVWRQVMRKTAESVKNQHQPRRYFPRDGRADNAAHKSRIVTSGLGLAWLRNQGLGLASSGFGFTFSKPKPKPWGRAWLDRASDIFFQWACNGM